MSEKKTININPDLFKVTGGTRKKKPVDPNKAIKVKAPGIRNNKTLRGKLLKYIREQQETNYRKNAENREKNVSKPAKNPLDDFNNDFENSLNYLMSISEETDQKEKQNVKNQTLRHYPYDNPSSLLFSNSINPHLQQRPAHPAYENISVDLPPIFEGPFEPISNIPMKINQQFPKYGCLKGGNLPTYRNWRNQTQRNYGVTASNMNDRSANQTLPNIPKYGGVPGRVPDPIILPKLNPSILNNLGTVSGGGVQNINMAKSNFEKETERFKKITEMNLLAEKNKPNKMPKMKYLKQKRTLKRTYHVGKSKNTPKVSVLVSNRTIRKTVSTKSQLLKQTPIEEIRKFLLKRGFIKVGSTSPNDVLRKMYESVVMISGDVTNHNPENLMFNFFNDK
jgi:hypothetical protein